MSKEAQTLNETQLKAKALSYFQANFNRPEVQNITVTPTFTQPQTGSFELKLVSSGTMNTTFTGIWQPTVTIGAKSEAKWGMKTLELALALDNTGSMASSQKMSNLKTAAKNLLDTLKKAAKKDGDVKVAIIPFDTTVKIGTGFKDQPWFDDVLQRARKPVGLQLEHLEELLGRLRARPHLPLRHARRRADQHQARNAVSDLRLRIARDRDAADLRLDRAQQQDRRDDAERQHQRHHRARLGLARAHQNAPLTEASAPKPDLDKVLIILTDGQNTESWKNSNNTKVTSSTAIDDRTKLACTNIKAANIKIYAIRVIDGNATLLKKCATNPTMYYDVQNASQLNAVFSAIAQNLANLRLAK